MAIPLPDIQTEDSLLRNARRGDKAAIMRIYDLYFPAVYQFLRLRVEDKTLAEDMASEVFVKLIDSLRKPTAPRQLRGWLFKVARGELHKHYGNIRQFPTTNFEDVIAAAEDEDLELRFIQTMNTERAVHAFRMLSEDQQEVLILRFGQGCSLEETADIMGRNVNAIKALQFRAVNTLRRIFGERGGDDDE
jgi:RNA polymerase sigma-70 factor (ECF subfamily)